MLPRLDVATPERVSVALPLAGIGTRSIAHLIDLAILFAGLMVVFFLSSLVVPDLLRAFEGLSGVSRAVGGLIAFAAFWGYWTGLEVAWRGQTIGKRLMRIRVVKSDGSPIGVFESAVRNLMRVIDFLPSCYPVGLISMLIDPRHRRLGDLLAGTMLVREEKIDLARYAASSASALSTQDLDVVTGFLARFDALQPEAQRKLGSQLLARHGVTVPDGDLVAMRARLQGLTAQGSAAAAGIGELVVRRQPEWEALSALLARLAGGQLKLEEIDRLDRLYRQASADLAQAQALYPGSDVHRFLNQLCGQAYGEIYQSRGNRTAAVKAFFTREFPQAVREELRYVGLSAGLLVLGIVLGAMTVAIAPQGVELFVPERLQPIVRSGRLWTDQLDGSSSPIAIAILTNNLRVTFTAFAFGISAGIGTLFVLVSNGLSVGALLTFTFQHGVGWRLLEFMAAHGPVELSVIALTGGAGLMIGHAMIDPGERPRSEAMRERAGKAVRIVLGCAPFLALIGVVEGFISPGTLFPPLAKAALGLALGLGFWGYLMRAGRGR